MVYTIECKVHVVHLLFRHEPTSPHDAGFGNTLVSTTNSLSWGNRRVYACNGSSSSINACSTSQQKSVGDIGMLSTPASRRTPACSHCCQCKESRLFHTYVRARNSRKIGMIGSCVPFQIYVLRAKGIIASSRSRRARAVQKHESSMLCSTCLVWQGRRHARFAVHTAPKDRERERGHRPAALANAK